MTTSLYFLAFAFLASTTLFFLLWHCRVTRNRQHERRHLETQDGAVDDSAFMALSGLTYLAQGAPTFLIRSLPTHVFSTDGCGGTKGGDGDKVGNGLF